MIEAFKSMESKRPLAIVGVVLLIISGIIISVSQSGTYLNANNEETETNRPVKLGASVHAYTLSHQLYLEKQSNSIQGNSIAINLNCYILNPLNNSDPSSDYYVFNIFVSASAQKPWYVTSNGFGDEHGPSLELTATTTPDEVICLDYISPSSLIVSNDGSKPQTIKAEMSVNPVTFGVSYTFTPSVSKTEPTVKTINKVGWHSAATTNGNPALPCHSYSFAFAVRVPKNNAATINLEAKADFYKVDVALPVIGIPITYSGDSVTVSLSGIFTSPPITTIDANPRQTSMIEVDGNTVLPPARFVWDEDNPHVISAVSPVSNVEGVRYIFQNWSDSGAMSHQINGPLEPTTITAVYETQYELTIQKCENGKLSPSTGSHWYSSMKSINITAIPESGYYLKNWIIDGINQNATVDITIFMDAPHSISAIFASSSIDNTPLIMTAIISIAIICIIVAIYLKKKRI
jgi:hypothetical protein